MRKEIYVRDYQPDDVQALANIYFHRIHKVNIQHYTEEQVNVWAPPLKFRGSRMGKEISQNQANDCHC